MLNCGPTMINQRLMGLMYNNHSRLKCYMHLQFMYVLDWSCVIPVYIMNCKKI